MKVSNRILRVLAIVGTSVFTSGTFASATSVTASLSWSTWKNATVSPSPSAFESGNHAATGCATRCIGRMPKALCSRRMLGNYTAVAKTTTVTVTSALPATETDRPHTKHIKWAMDPNGISENMSEITANFEAIVSAFINERKSIDHGKINSSGSNAASGTNSIVESNDSDAVNRAAIDLPAGSIIFLNTTSPSYVLTHRASAIIFVWTAPTNSSAAETDTQLRKIVDNINTWLPYFEALGLVAVVWEVSMFVNARILIRYKRRARAGQA